MRIIRQISLPPVGTKNKLIEVPSNPKIIRVGLNIWGNPSFWVEGDVKSVCKIEISVISDNDPFVVGKEMEYQGSCSYPRFEEEGHLYRHYQWY